MEYPGRVRSGSDEPYNIALWACQYDDPKMQNGVVHKYNEQCNVAAMRSIEQGIMRAASLVVYRLEQNFVEADDVDSYVSEELKRLDSCLRTVAARERVFKPQISKKQASAPAAATVASASRVDEPETEIGAASDSTAVDNVSEPDDTDDAEPYFDGYSVSAWSELTPAERANEFKTFNVRRRNIVHALVRHAALLSYDEDHDDKSACIFAYEFARNDDHFPALWRHRWEDSHGTVKDRKRQDEFLVAFIKLVFQHFANIDVFEEAEADGGHGNVAQDFVVSSEDSMYERTVLQRIGESPVMRQRMNFNLRHHMDTVNHAAMRCITTFRMVVRSGCADFILKVLDHSYRARYTTDFFTAAQCETDAHERVCEKHFMPAIRAKHRKQSWCFAPPARALALLRVAEESDHDEFARRIVELYSRWLFKACTTSRSFEHFARLRIYHRDVKLDSASHIVWHEWYATQLLHCDGFCEKLDDVALRHPMHTPDTARVCSVPHMLELDKSDLLSSWSSSSVFGDCSATRERERLVVYAVSVLVTACFRLRQYDSFLTRPRSSLYPLFHDKNWYIFGRRELRSSVFTEFSLPVLRRLLAMLPQGLPACLRVGDQRTPLIQTMLTLPPTCVHAWCLPRDVLAHRARVFCDVMEHVPDIGMHMLRRDASGQNALHRLARSGFPVHMMEAVLKQLSMSRCDEKYVPGANRYGARALKASAEECAYWRNMRRSCVEQLRPLIDKRVKPNYDSIYYGTTFHREKKWSCPRTQRGALFAWANGPLAVTFPDCTPLQLACIALGHRRLSLLNGIGGYLDVSYRPAPIQPVYDMPELGEASRKTLSLPELLIRYGADPCAKTSGYHAFKRQRNWVVAAEMAAANRIWQRHYDPECFDWVSDADASDADGVDEDGETGEAGEAGGAGGAGASALKLPAVRLVLKGGDRFVHDKVDGVNLAGIGGFHGPSLPLCVPKRLVCANSYGRLRRGRAVETDYDACVEADEARIDMQTYMECEARKPERGSGKATSNTQQCRVVNRTKPGIDAAVAALQLRERRERAVEHVLHGEIAREEQASAALLYMIAWSESFGPDEGTGDGGSGRAPFGLGTEALDVMAHAIRVVFIDNEDVEMCDAVAIYDEVVRFLDLTVGQRMLKAFEQQMRGSRVASYKRKRATDDVFARGVKSAAWTAPGGEPPALRRAAASGALRLQPRV